MRRLHVIDWLRNVSISKKLYFTVGIMGLLIMIELGTLTFAIKTLSSVRTYVGAEGLWSKAQKDAAYSLRKYGRSHNENDYKEYQSFLKVPLGDRKTRLELMKQKPDMNIAREGFVEGRLHPNDIDGAITLFVRFNNIYYINKAIGIWAKGDTLMLELETLGKQLHEEITAASPSQERISQILDSIDPVNDKLTQMEDDFSFTLGEGSRWLEHLILKLLFGLVLTVEICGLSLTIYVSRSISRGLKEIIRSSEKITQGDLDTRAKVYSRDEIGILANSFNDMTIKLQENINALKESEENLINSKKLSEQSLTVKENFLANMSHEIRTPMNAVLGFTNLLENTNLDEEQLGILRAIKVAEKSLMAIINDILDYSKIESGMIILEQIPFNFRGIFESLQVLLQQKATEKKLVLEFNVDKNIPEFIVGDPTRLMQILLNLTDNALKFTEKGSVEIFANKVNNDRNDDEVTIKFEVMDTGVGIPKNKFSVIFERFTQISADTTRKYGGTGLGLSIVKNLVSLQHGTLSLKSEPGMGSVFSFTITYPIAKAGTEPQKEDKKPAPPIAVVPKTSTEPLQILLAEDNPLNQMLVTKSFSKYNVQVDIADNGKIAIEKMKAKKYDLILMDIQMPEMDGHEATRIIRHEFKSNIPIIAVTAHAMNNEKEKCYKSGMNDFVSKPFDPKELYGKIMTLCGGETVAA